MDETNDSRYANLEKGYDAEIDQEKDIASATGFGRSTNTEATLSKSSQEYQTRLASLAKIIDLEALYKSLVTQGADSQTIQGVQESLQQENANQNQLNQNVAQKKGQIVGQANQISFGKLDQLKSNLQARGGIQINPQSQKLGIKVGHSTQGAKQPGPARAFTPVKSTSVMLAPVGKNTFKKTLVPTRKTFHL